MIHLFATYDHRNVRGTPRHEWFAVVNLKVRGPRSQSLCVDAVPFPTLTHAEQSLSAITKTNLGNTLGHYRVIVAAEPSDYDTVMRAAFTQRISLPWRKVNPTSLCNWLRRIAGEAYTKIEGYHAKLRYYNGTPAGDTGDGPSGHGREASASIDQLGFF